MEMEERRYVSTSGFNRVPSPPKRVGIERSGNEDSSCPSCQASLSSPRERCVCDCVWPGGAVAGIELRSGASPSSSEVSTLLLFLSVRSASVAESTEIKYGGRPCSPEWATIILIPLNVDESRMHC